MSSLDPADWPDARIRAQSLAKYARSAADYDQTCGPIGQIRRNTVAALQLRPGQRVLDVGCGTGLSLPLLRGAVGPTGVVYGFDQSPEMLAPLNAWVYWKNRGYNGAPGELHSPWDRIAPHLEAWQIAPTQYGMGYIGTGRVRQGAVHASQGPAAAEMAVER